MTTATNEADAIYINGHLITMNDAQPRAEAIAVKEGKILAVGANADIAVYQGAATVVHDLAGKTMTPGFVDGHGHASMCGLAAVGANLYPAPDGKVTSIHSLQQSFRDWVTSSTVPQQYHIIYGWGYDDSQLAEQRHPTRDDLDEISKELPVMAIHQSGHLRVVNSKALELLGFTAQSKDPAGGAIRRRSDSSEPNGVLEENAHIMAYLRLVESTLAGAKSLNIAVAGQALYARYGYTTCQDGASTPQNIVGFIAAAESGQLKSDVAAYMFAPTVKQAMEYMTGPYRSPDYTGHFRIAGVKLVLDGSPQGKTAWFTEPYFVPPEGRDNTYRGYPNMTNEEVLAYVEQAFDHEWQILAHCNGDAALDQYLDAIAQVSQRKPNAKRRSVAIHSQTARLDQVDRMKALGVTPSFYSAHTYYWGDWHRDSVLGPKRAENISPTGWAIERDMMFTVHHDAPIIPPNALMLMWATVNRRTRSGQVLGPQQCVTPEVALRAITLWSAWQHFEEDRKGSLEVGKLADLVILSDDPLTIDPGKIREIEVLNTIKEGREIYRASSTS